MGKIKQKKKLERAFKSSHNLIFEQAPYEFDPQFHRFRIGTCGGFWGVEGKSYVILVIINEQPGNGHLQDVFEWFERSCLREGYSLKIVEFFNEQFRRHLIDKLGFKVISNGVEKHFS